ncbi:branched-chain amino acid transport system II carrier protein [Bacillus sp. FSL W7-1360]
MNTGTKISNKETIFIGLMLFSLFFGAGNLIFPPVLGQDAGMNAWSAIVGFLISGVSLPILGVLAITYLGSDDAEGLSKRVGIRFSIAFTSLTFLTIGPFFAMPRTGNVAYEIGVVPFLEQFGVNQSSPAFLEAFGIQSWPLFLFTIIYFTIVYVLALRPGKFVDRIGKILTPLLFTVIGILLVSVMTGPLGTFQAPKDAYASYPLFKGFTEGYLTMDTIASFVFGIIIVKAIKDRGVSNPLHVRKVAWKAGLVAAIPLALIYAGLGYLGAVSTSAVGDFESNGASLLVAVAREYFGLTGNVILGLTILFACIPTAAGLASACSMYFRKYFPGISYKVFVFVFVLFSAIIANVGLDQLIRFSIPVLQFIYPIIIVLIFLAFFDKLIGKRRAIYQFTVLFTAIVSFNAGLKEFNEEWDLIGRVMTLPLMDQGLAWLLPAAVGLVLGVTISFFKKS